MFDIRDIILLILIIMVIYLLYKDTTKENTQENFDTLYEYDIKNAVNNQYQIDIDAMRNLGQISQNILSNNTLTLPANIIIPDSLTIKKDLIVEGNVTFTNRNNHINNLFDILPRYTVISYADEQFPQGWVLCDGNYYYPETHNDKFRIIPVGLRDSVSNAIKTPNLLNRCIIGAGRTANDKRLNTPGGSSTVTLDTTNLPSHSHKMFSKKLLENGEFATYLSSPDISQYYVSAAGDRGNSNSYLLHSDNIAPIEWMGKTSDDGGSQPFSILQPYNTLYYIMKLF